MSEAQSQRYSGVAIALHWAMAALLLFMIWLGWNMDENEARYQLHKSIGITILFLTLSRIAWRALNPPPAMESDISGWEKWASHAVHVAFYFLMIAIPLGGWLLVSVSPFQVATVLFGVIDWPHLPFTAGLRSEDLYEIVENLHSKGAWVILGLLALHMAGAVKHEMGVEEGVLRRMIPIGGLEPRKTSTAMRSAVIAFGGSVLLFAIIAGTSLMGNGGSARAATPPVEATGNWEVDYDASEIRFSGTNDGTPFSGTFRRWQADISFDPEDVENASVNVTVDVTSAATGSRLYDSTLRDAEWFNISAHPQATVTLSEFEERSDSYRATATLTLKGQPVSERLEFTLDITGETGVLSGEAVYSRRDLNLGMVSDPDGKWVSDEIVVAISGQARRIR
ncbi:MAG: cytochrome b/b6 domain-containing protein, partial [Pararhodobacter sp.]